MAEWTELSFTWRAFLSVYRWRRIDPVPWARLRRPLREANVALVSTAGAFAPGQKPFDAGLRGGDYSFRLIDSDTSPSALSDSHRSEAFDHSGIRADMNLAYPIDRMRELEREGIIGSFNRRTLSFMGSITAPNRLIRDTAPEAAELLVEDRVDAALLVPV